MTKEKFEKIIKLLNDIKPYNIGWGCGNEFGGYGCEREIEGLDGTIEPLVCDREVFGFRHEGYVYYRTDNLNALNIAKMFARQNYVALQSM